MKQDRKIGGFLGLELPQASPAGTSVWDHFTTGAVQIVTRATARGALSALITSARPKRVWYPAYYCPEAVIGGDHTDVEFYPVNVDLAPDVPWLDARLASNDMVVGVDFFGLPVARPFRKLVERWRDVYWIEDRAQAIAPGPVWGDWILHSPGKLFGVPDGGLAACQRHDKMLTNIPPPVEPDHERTQARLLPLVWRHQDRSESDNCDWYAAYRNAERMGYQPEEAISRLAAGLLQSIAVGPCIERRLENSRVLARLLPDTMSLFNGEPETPLLAYPIVIKNRDQVATMLAGRGVFCPVHWRNQLSPENLFPLEHKLSREILSLPCDQRYGPSEMEAVAELLVQTVRDAGER